MKDNPLLHLKTFGQSVWMDFIRRGMLSSGELGRLMEEDGLCGITSNPSIFEKAIAGSRDYVSAIRALALEGKGVEEIYEALTVEDIQHTADLFRPLYDRTGGADGFVSIEVSPHLAHDAAATIVEARRLWSAVNRSNAMIKVPATREGLKAIRQLIAEGLNINVTLLFGLPRYREVAEAYIAGLEVRKAQGRPLGHIASVASFFLSRIDVLIDPILEKVMSAGGDKFRLAAALRGQVAIASAKVAYQIFNEIFYSERFRALAGHGARNQRLLWASTSTKNPEYSDVKYVEPLIGPETVNTMPLETLVAYRDHGNPASSLTHGVAEAAKVLEQLPDLGIDLDAITQKLEDEGVVKFVKPYDLLMRTLKDRRGAALEEPVDRQRLSLAGYEKAVKDRIASLKKQQFCTRLWRKDPSLWKADPAYQKNIRDTLGWLHVAEKMEEQIDVISIFVSEVRAAGFRHVVDMGMGGSSLAPLAFGRLFPLAGNGLPMTVLDTTDPATIRKLEQEIPLADSLFIVASKSGTTSEALAFGEYFYARVMDLKGVRAGENFVAVTDPGTPLVKVAQERHFRRTFLNFTDIGGRYSALSYFGLVPAALVGVDVAELLVRALRMVHACASCLPACDNPGVLLGATMAQLVLAGRNKVTLLMPEPIASLGMWLEQLIAESTGKEGTGLLPVAGEPPGDPLVYGDDRFFVYLYVRGEVDGALEHRVEALRGAGHPVVTIQMEDRLDLGQEFIRWEVATATASSILGINAFDQPNVQESKDNTRRLLAVVREQGSLPEERAALVEGPLSLNPQGAARTVTGTLREFLAQVRPGDYIALLAYLAEDPGTDKMLQTIRLTLRDRLHVATTLGYGPRFLHSTGQFHKGGPNTGLFLQLTADDAVAVPIPGQPYSFGVLKRAQALGDLEALRRHGRRAVRIHLGKDVGQGLDALKHAVEGALGAGGVL